MVLVYFYVDGPGVVGGRFTILENGNVGIEKTNPTTKLYVDGTLAASTLIISGGADFGTGIKQVLLLNVE